MDIYSLTLKIFTSRHCKANFSLKFISAIVGTHIRCHLLYRSDELDNLLHFAEVIYSFALSNFLEMSPFEFILSWVRISPIRFLENASISLYIFHRVLFQNLVLY